VPFPFPSRKNGMKRAFMPALCMLVLLTGCGGDDPAGPDNNNGSQLINGTFNATVNGSAFNAMVAGAAVGQGAASIGATKAQHQGQTCAMSQMAGQRGLARTTGADHENSLHHSKIGAAA
jgi:hypothetical protein